MKQPKNSKHKTKKTFSEGFKEIFLNKHVFVAILITFVLIMLFHIGTRISLPGVSVSEEAQIDDSTFVGLLNLLAGGGLAKVSIFAVSVGPYITAQIIIQLLSSDLIPPLSRMAKAGEKGKRKLEIVTRLTTLPFCFAQAYASIALILSSLNTADATTITIFGASSINDLSAGDLTALMFLLTGGTYIAIFIGDLITKRGVGNGITLIILSGILGSLIPNFQVVFETMFGNSTGSLMVPLISFIGYILFFLFVLLAVVFVNGSTRKIPVQQVGQGLNESGDKLPFLPIKLNAAGVIPVIFASSILTIPGTIAQFLPDGSGARDFINQYFVLNSWSGLSIYFVLIILFSFFYSYIQINPQQLSDNFEKSGRFIPGVRTGEDTEKHITKVLMRINFIGAPFLALIASLPYIIALLTGIPSGIALGGTGIIIIVSGTMELWYSIKSAATTTSYSSTKKDIEKTLAETMASEAKGLW